MEDVDLVIINRVHPRVRGSVDWALDKSLIEVHATRLMARKPVEAGIQRQVENLFASLWLREAVDDRIAEHNENL